jgi:meso-butanediol dehydrogenase/(S,S)-butanediol dehydrogenase/diacetyl reductase
MAKIMITGSSSGLGYALATALEDDGHDIINFNHENGNDVRNPRMTWEKPGGDPPAMDVLINCAGVNRIDWLENFSEEDWDLVMDTNAKGIFMMSQWCLPSLIASRGTILNIVSNAAHVPMTCSLAYNASKAAAWIMTQQLARELTKKHNITVFGVAPNKLAGTSMSRYIEERVLETRGWSAEQARNYQLAALPAGEETPAEAVADFIVHLLDTKDHHRFLSGVIIPYGG